MEGKQLDIAEYLSRFPSRLSGTSEVLRIEPRIYTGGVVLSDLTEVESALRDYNDEFNEDTDFGSKRKTEERIGIEVASKSGYKAELECLYDEARSVSRKTDFVGRNIMPRVREELRNLDACGLILDNDAWGTNFLKTSVIVIKLGDKYVLQIGKGDHDEEIAKSVGKTCALKQTEIKIGLNRVDDWWVNIDFAYLFRGVDAPKAVTDQLLDYLQDKEKNSDERIGVKRPVIEFEYEGEKFRVDVSSLPNASGIERVGSKPYGGGPRKDWSVIVDGSLVKPAWYKRESSGDLPTFEKIDPELTLSVKNFNQRRGNESPRHPKYVGPFCGIKIKYNLVLDPDKIEKVKAARDHLITKLPKPRNS